MLVLAWYIQNAGIAFDCSHVRHPGQQLVFGVESRLLRALLVIITDNLIASLLRLFQHLVQLQRRYNVCQRHARVVADLCPRAK